MQMRLLHTPSNVCRSAIIPFTDSMHFMPILINPLVEQWANWIKGHQFFMLMHLMMSQAHAYWSSLV